MPNKKPDFNAKKLQENGYVWVAGALINYIVFLIAFKILNVAYLASSAIGHLSGIGLVACKNSFTNASKKKGGLVKGLLIFIISLFLNLSVLKTMVYNFHLNAVLASVLVILSFTLINFLGHKYILPRKTKIPEIFCNKWFIAVLALKILFSLLFGSDLLVKGTVPFANYFVSSGFDNPYDFFLGKGLLKAFPYSTIMLIVVAFPTYLFYFLMEPSWQSVGLINLILARVPLILADIGIFYILIMLLKNKEKGVLLFYWCSPIVFYISYFHGQLDVIPTFFLILSMYLLLGKKEILSFLFLGISLASKANILAAFPFIFLYLWRNKYSIFKIAKYFCICLVVYAALILPFVFSQGYKRLVLLAEEQNWLFILQVPYIKDNLVIYAAPFVISLLFFRMAYFKSINRDSFIMSLAVAFIILVSFVPPRPGWFLWSIPFLTYFFIKEGSISKKHYISINALYILHFIVLHRDSDIFKSFQIFSPFIAKMDNPYNIMLHLGINIDIIVNIVFTLFISALLANAFFVYKLGILSNLEYKASGLNIGIAGDSGSGKTWMTNLLRDLVGEKNIAVLEGDDLHKWERGHKNWNVVTHLNPKGNRLNLDIEHLKSIRENKIVFRKKYDHKTGKLEFYDRLAPSKFVIVSGLHSFYISKTRDLLDTKIFMEPEEQLRNHWKIIRDMKEREYTKERVIDQIRKRVPDSKKYIGPQKKFADIMVRYEAKKEIKNLGDEDMNVHLLLKLTLNNNYSPHEIMDKIQKVKTLKTDFAYNDNMLTYTCRFEGTVQKKEIERMAYDLVPNIKEVVNNDWILWHGDYEGVLQLFMLYVISENLKVKGDLRYV